MSFSVKTSVTSPHLDSYTILSIKFNLVGGYRMEALDLVTTGVGMVIGKGIGNFATALIFNGRANDNFNFKIANKVDTNIGYDARLNLQERNFHLTIDLDLRF